MNPFLGLNNGMFSVNMAVMLLGASRILYPATTGENTGFIPEMLFLIFFILLRIKIYVNDSFLILNKENDDRPYPAYGRFTSIIAWILFSFSAYSLPKTLSYWFFIFAFVCSSTWILLYLYHAKDESTLRKNSTQYAVWKCFSFFLTKMIFRKRVEDKNGRNKKLCQESLTWLCANLVYGILAYMLIKDPTEPTKWLIVIIMLIALALDVFFGKAWKHLGSKT